MLDRDIEVVESSEAVAESTLTLTEVAKLIDEKLAQQQAQHTAELTKVRKEAIRQVALASGKASADDIVEEFVSKAETEAAKNALDKKHLSHLFGPSSNAAEAAKLYKADFETYQRLRQRSIEVGLLDAPNRAVNKLLFHPSNKG